MTDPGGLARAVQELLTERQECADRLEKLDAAIAAVQNLLNLAPPAAAAGAVNAPRVPSSAQPPPRIAGRKSGAVRQQILDALRKGPLSPTVLARAVSMETGATMYHVKQLAASGAVALTGASNFNRRVALPSHETAKEAP